MGTGVRIATASVRTGLAMTWVFHGGAVCGGAHGPRPTRAFARIAGGQGRPPLRCCVTKKCVGEGLCPSRGRGNRRSAAGGGCSEPVSRKCPDWRTRQWPGIGWHDGGQENPAPTEALQEVQWAGDRKGRPYESVTRGAMGGRPQGSPLRRGYKECDAVRNPPFLRPFKIIFSSLLLSMQRMCFSGHR